MGWRRVARKPEKWQLTANRRTIPSLTAETWLADRVRGRLWLFNWRERERESTWRQGHVRWMEGAGREVNEKIVSVTWLVIVSMNKKMYFLVWKTKRKSLAVRLHQNEVIFGEVLKLWKEWQEIILDGYQYLPYCREIFLSEEALTVLDRDMHVWEERCKYYDLPPWIDCRDLNRYEMISMSKGRRGPNWIKDHTTKW